METSIKVTYLTSSHYVNDDRIYYHIKETLETKGCEVSVCSSYGVTENKIKNGYTVNGSNLSKKDKINWFYQQLVLLKPKVVICAEPLPIIAAKKYKKEYSCKIIYDVTEWYPSKKNLQGLSFVSKIIKGLVLFFFNIYASCFVDGFIVGEYYKKKLYDVLFPLKSKKIISYYTKKKYVTLKEKTLTKGVFKIGYTGKFSQEKGLHRVFKVADFLRKNNPNIDIVLILIGEAYSEHDKLFFKELLQKYPLLKVEIHNKVSFDRFSNAIVVFDVALDLRDNDFENTRCLPIKVFHYNACGIPVVYSSLKAIKKGYVQADFCKLLLPDDIDEIGFYLQKFIDQPDFYKQTSKKAVKEIEKGYLWEHIEEDLFGFIKKIKG
ncbi:glycosyltransferase [Wenyingzhuangia sp. IMCC45467]